MGKKSNYEKALSIPLWSDFIQKELAERGKEGLVNFQSHYGLILSFLNNKTNIFQQHFQSHYGLILSSYTKRAARLKRNSFQSHYGLILSPKPHSRLMKSGSPFNPTMVWFYPLDLAILCALVAFFQSHYGLILSLNL